MAAVRMQYIEDIVRFKQGTIRGFVNTRFLTGTINIQLTDMAEEQGERRPWIHQLQDSDVALPVVNIAESNSAVEGEASAKFLQTAMLRGESIVTLEWSNTTTIILASIDVDDFCQGLVASPLNRWLPQITGSSKGRAAIELLSEKILARGEVVDKFIQF